MKKRILSLFMALVMALSLVPGTAFAVDETYSVAPDAAVQEAAEPVLLAAEGDAKPKITAMKFAGTPTFDSQVTYHGQPEGTLFQVDENGNLGEIGLAENCFNYSVYVSALEKSVRPEGKNALAISKAFAFSTGCTQVVIKVGNDVLIQGKTTIMSVAKEWLNSPAKLNETTTVMTIELVKGEEASLYTVKFIKEKMSLGDLKSSLDKVNLEDLSNEENSRRMVDKLYQSFNDLSGSDQQLLPEEYYNKLNTAYQKTRDLSKPIRLEIVTAPAKTDYAAGQTFDPTGVVIQAVYEGNSTKIINDLDWTYEPKSPLSNETEATFTFNDLSVKQVISVLDLNMEGAGTDISPYLLSTAENLENLRRFVELGGSTEGKYFRFAANITLPEGWKPIGCLKDPSVANSDIQKGTNLYAFSGSIDGANYTLTVPEGGVPLLGYVKGAEVKNLSIYGERIEGYGLVNNFEGVGLTGSAVVIDNVTLKSGSKTLKSGLIGANITTNGFAGCSAGFVATIRNCTIEKNVVVGYAEDQFVIGSIAGRLQGTVENCVSYATVKGKNYVGGIVGMRDNAMGQCEISNCRFAGNVVASGDFVGGIVGGGYGNSSAPNGIRTSVQGCVVSGTILGKNNVGGILGGDAMVAQSWDTHYFVGNTFIGKVGGEKNVGAIIGLYQSLNVFDNISGNVYQKDCGADRGIAAVEYVDTSYANPTPVDGVLYFNTAKGTENCPEVKWCNWKANLNRTDDPLGADADKLTVAVKDASTPVCYNLGISGNYKTTYIVGDSLDFSGAVFTAHWTMDKADTIVNAKDIVVSGFDSNTRGQQTVTLSYGAAKVEITVTVLLPVGKDITVTFTLLGDTAHGDDGETHTLSGGGLQTWISKQDVTLLNTNTVRDLLEMVLGDAYAIRNSSGNYVQGITPKGGEELSEFTNGGRSGWMYTLNGVHGDLGVAEQYLDDGDVIVFHYTDDYTLENGSSADVKTPDQVIVMIDAIGLVDMTKGAAISSARAAYDTLSPAEKTLVSNYQTLLDAEAAYAKLVAELGKKIGDIYTSVGESLQAQVNKAVPIVGSIGGEWLVIDLARSGRTVPAGYYDNVVAYVKAEADANERLHNTKSTENSRVILALTAIGKDVTNVGGHNLLKGLDNMAYLQKQGINGPIWALIALDSHKYPTSGDVTREKLVQVILGAALPSGGWAHSGETADPDMTGMAIQALAPYYKTNEAVKVAVDKALGVLSDMQQDNGGFSSWGTVNSESCAQVVVALTALGIDPTVDGRFIKNGMSVLDALCGFYVTGGGFGHDNTEYNQMATEQAYYALAAYYRLVNKENTLYDMSDVCIGHTFGDWTVTEATCTEEGSRTRKCSVCGAVETETIKALGHSLTAVAAKAATCTESGNSAHWDCARCGKSFSDAAAKTEIAKDSWVIAALGHDEATRAAVAATCYASGHGADTYCKRCDLVLVAGATIPATGKHTYVNGVCSTCGVKNPAADVKSDGIKVDSKNDKTAAGGGLVVKSDNAITDEVLIEIKTAVDSGSITVTVNNTPLAQATREQKAADGGKSALTEAAKNASDEVKQELNKLAEKLDALRGDSSRKNAQIEKVVDVTVELVKSVNDEIKSVAQLIELPHSVTVTIPITDELYAALQGKRVCVVRSHTDVNGNVTTAELSATLGGTKGNYVLTFQTDKASTFAIVSYETVSTGGGGSHVVNKPTSASTADDSQMVLWLGSAMLAAAGVAVLTRKKRAVK